MNKHTDGDPLAELAALRQRLDKLEAEHREPQAEASLARCHVPSRKFVLSALAVVLLLTAVGVLYAVDALFIDQNGKVKVEGDLEVTGKVNNNLYVSGGVENLRLLWGTVDGEKRDGLGVKAYKEYPEAVGLYFISFPSRFKSMPAASVTAFNENPKGVDHSAIINRLTETGMWVQTTNRNGQPEERKFSFLVIGR